MFTKHSLEQDPVFHVYSFVAYLGCISCKEFHQSRITHHNGWKRFSLKIITNVINNQGQLFFLVVQVKRFSASLERNSKSTNGISKIC